MIRNWKTPYERCLEADANKPKIYHYCEFTYTVKDKRLTVTPRKTTSG